MAEYTGANTMFLSDAFQSLNNALSTFVTEFSSDIALEIAPLVAGCLTLSFIALGIMSIRGMLDRPFMEVAMKMFWASVISTLALTSAVYQVYIVDVFLTLPDDLVSSVVANSVGGAEMQTGQAAATAIEQLYDTGTYNAGLYFEQVSIGVTDTDLLPAVYGLLVFIGTLLCVIIGTLWLFVAKVILALMLGVGPIFICFLIWKPTHQYFFSWIGQILNTVISAIFVIAIFAIFSAIFQANLNALTIEEDTNNFMDAATFTFLGLLCMGVLMQIPQYVSGLTGAAAGAVGTAMLKVGGGGAGGAKAAAGAVTGGAVGGARGAMAANSAVGAYNQARKGGGEGKGASVMGAARGARHEFNKANQEMKQGYPDYFRKGTK